jgi:hypothetical protein
VWHSLLSNLSSRAGGIVHSVVFIGGDLIPVVGAKSRELSVLVARLPTTRFQIMWTGELANDTSCI